MAIIDDPGIKMGELAQGCSCAACQGAQPLEENI